MTRPDSPPPDPARPTVGEAGGGVRSRGHWWRTVRRGLVVLGVAAMGLGLLAVYGWRYGFGPLPEPVVDAPGNPTTPGLWQEGAPTPDNYWYWVEKFSRVDTLDRRQDLRLASELSDWARLGHLAATNRVALAAFYEGNAAIASIAAGVREASGLVPMQPGVDQYASLSTAHAKLLHHAAWQASVGEQDQRADVALGQVLEGLRLSLVPPPFGPMPGELSNFARAWRRIVVEGPPLEASAGRELLGRLDAVIAAQPTFEARFRRVAALTTWQTERSRQVQRYDVSLTAQFRRAFGGMTTDFLESIGNLMNRLMGDRRRAETSGVRGVRRLGQPLEALMLTLQGRLARPEDVARVKEAYLSRTAAALRRGDLTAAEGEASALRAAFATRSWYARWFDRPAAWRAALDGPALDPLIERGLAAQAALESCRLVLALRMYRDAHGIWPGRLEELVPTWLPSVPVDPYTQRPFQYERDGTGWLVRAAVENAGAPDVGEEGILFHSAEAAEERLLRLLAGQAGPVAGVMDVGLLVRYGLWPRGFPPAWFRRGEVPRKGPGLGRLLQDQLQTNASLALSLTGALSGVTNLRALIQSGDAGIDASRTALSNAPPPGEWGPNPTSSTRRTRP